MTDDVEKQLEEEFGVFGIDIEGNLVITEKLATLCSHYKLNCTDICANWMAFALNNKKDEQNITPELLDDFEKKSLLNSKKSNQSSAGIAYNTTSSINETTYDTDVFESYGATPKGKTIPSKRPHTTPDSNLPENKRRAGNIQTTPSTHSPPDLSTHNQSSSMKYDSRSNKGEVALSYGLSGRTAVEWQGCAQNINIENYRKDGSLTTKYKHMFQKIQDKSDVLNSMISSLSEQIKDSLMLDDFGSTFIKGEEETTVAGRICCDSVGRLNSKSVVLEGSNEESNGMRVPLDLTETKNYSVFPGQIVAVRGRNVTGTRFYTNSIFGGCRLPFRNSTEKEAIVNEAPFTLYVSCGPYANTSEENTLSYKPLEDLMQTVKIEKPDVLFMLGPFVDVKQPLIKNADIDETYEELFEECCNIVNKKVKDLRTQVAFIPSHRDVFHTFVYPQPPFEENKKWKIRMLSDPCTVMVNDVCVGITSTDVLFHLGGEEVSQFDARSDRLGRLSNHLLQQQCYYPLHPTSEEVNLDYEQFEQHAFMPVTPDVLITPSDLRYFIKDIEGCLCVNPGRLVKGQTGGTYLKLLVKPKKENNKSCAVTHSVAQIVRI